MNMLGHNQGPSMEAGESWRRHCWKKARQNLVKTLPVEILRTRVARAAELGLDYRAYASIRAASGHDVIAFLFSSNALRLLPHTPMLSGSRAGKIAAVKRAHRVALLHIPLTPSALARAVPEGLKPLFEASFAAPDFAQNWGQVRETILAQTRAMRLPRDGVVVVGDTTHERAWAEAARLAGYVSAERFFQTGI